MYVLALLICDWCGVVWCLQEYCIGWRGVVCCGVRVRNVMSVHSPSSPIPLADLSCISEMVLIMT